MRKRASIFLDIIAYHWLINQRTELHLLICYNISSLFIAKLEKGLDEHTHTHTHIHTHTHTHTYTHIYIYVYIIYIYILYRIDITQ